MLFCNIDLLDEKFETKRNQYVGVKDGRIAYIGASEPEDTYGFNLIITDFALYG